jgi:hypothetical protein
MLGDKTDDSAELRDELPERGTKPVIPNQSCRKQPFSKARGLIENAFRRLKDFRRIATRYDRLARKLSGLCLPRRPSCMVDLMSLDPSIIAVPDTRIHRIRYLLLDGRRRARP